MCITTLTLPLVFVQWPIKIIRSEEHRYFKNVYLRISVYICYFHHPGHMISQSQPATFHSLSNNIAFSGLLQRSIPLLFTTIHLQVSVNILYKLRLFSVLNTPQYLSPGIIRLIKSRIIRWAWHVWGTGEVRTGIW